LNIRVEYTDEADRAAKLETYKDKIFIEEANIKEGNFLIFSDTKPLENQLTDLNNTVNMILLKQEGII
jgi:hypothetical protein